MKKIALALAATLASTPAMAGPYVNVETNADYTGSDYTSRATDLHVGYENNIGDLAYYLQGGNCLLYTSPSPRDLSTSRMPSSA